MFFKHDLHLERPGRSFLFDFREILLRYGERDVNRVNLVDGQEGIIRALTTLP